MKTFKDKESRQQLTQDLRKAICLQISLWDMCSDVINEIFDDECDAVSRVIEITPEYSGKQLTEDDLNTVLAGLEEMNLAVPIGQGKKVQGVDKLDAATRRTLLKAFQNAISMQSELWITVGALADTLDCTLEYVEDAIRGFATTADTGMELGEPDLRELLDEPHEGFTRLGGPLKSQVQH